MLTKKQIYANSAQNKSEQAKRTGKFSKLYSGYVSTQFRKENVQDVFNVSYLLLQLSREIFLLSSALINHKAFFKLYTERFSTTEMAN